MSETDIWVNPIYESLPLENNLRDSEPSLKGASYTVYSLNDAAQKVKSQMKNRTTSFNIHYMGSALRIFDTSYWKSLGYSSFGGYLRSLAFTHNGNPLEGDSLKGNCIQTSIRWSGTTTNWTMYFTIMYTDSASYLSATNSACASILSSLNLNGKSDYEKVKAIYNWLTANVTYDRSSYNMSSATPYLKHSTYAAVVKRHAVCQGYATAFYRLCLAAGVDARYITSEDHAWNIAKVGSYYYNLDSTWDAGLSANSWKYFLKGSKDFASDYHHIRESEYLSGSFSSKYPMASTVYNPTTNITGLKSTVSGNVVKLTWNALSGRKQYEIWRSTSANTGYTKLGSCYGNTATFSGLEYGRTYYYKVRALMTNGQYSNYSSVIKAVTGNGQVSGVKSTVSGNSVKLTWSALPGRKQYEIWRSTSANTGYTKLGSCYGTMASYSGLEYGRTYYYKVRALLTNGQYSNYSSVIKVVTGNGQVSGVKSTVSGNSVKLTWNALPGRKQYEIWRSTSANTGYTKLGSCYGNTATFSGLEYGRTYYYKVRALLTNGKYSNYSSVIKAMTGNGQVSGVKSTISGNSVKLTWNALSGRKQYEIWRSTSANTGYTRLGTCYGNTATFSGLEYGRTYYYKVRALMTNGQYSGYSAALKAVTGNGQVSGLKASVNGTNVALSWNALPGRVKYEIWRSTSNSEYVKLGTCYGNSVNFSGLAGGTTYYYKVRALLTDNKYSEYNTAVTVAIPAYWAAANSENVTEECSEDGTTCTISEKVCTDTGCTITSKVCVVVGNQKACAEPVVTVVPIQNETPAPAVAAVEPVVTEVAPAEPAATEAVPAMPAATEAASAMPAAEVTEECSEDGSTCTVSEKVCTDSGCTITSKVCVVVGDQKACADPMVTVVPVQTETPAATEAAPVEPAETEAAPAEPAATEAAPAEPAETEAAPAEPAATEAVPAEPAATEAVPAEPAATEAVPAEPAETEAAPVEPAATEAVPAEPAATEAAPVEPAATEAVPVEPAATEAAPAEPAVTEAAPAEPAETEAVPAEPVETEAAPAEPAETEAAPVEPAETEAAPVEPTPTEDLTIREIYIEDLTEDTITFKALESYIIKPEKLKVVPEAADWANLSFTLDDETIAVFKTVDIETIKAEGLTINALVPGTTTLRVRAGEVEKSVTLVITLSEADIQATLEAEAAAQAAAEATPVPAAE